MEQPLRNNSESSTASSPASEPGKKQQKRKLPSPRELVSHYEAQGMKTQDASFKVIEDLQNALFRMMVSSSAGRNSPTGPRPSSENSKKLDVIGARLLQLEMKVDSKPGYPQTLALGVASGALLRAAGEIWTAVRRATSSNTDH